MRVDQICGVLACGEKAKKATVAHLLAVIPCIIWRAEGQFSCKEKSCQHSIDMQESGLVDSRGFKETVGSS